MKRRVTSHVSSSVKRVPINPNRATRRNPNWTVVGFEEVGIVPRLGETFIAVQSYDDGDLLSSGVVTQIDETNRLIFAEVDWASFSKVQSQLSSASNKAVPRFSLGRGVPTKPPAVNAWRVKTRMAA